MRLKLEELQNVVKNVMNEEKHSEAFREEVVRVVGPRVLTTHGLRRMAESANHQLDIMERTGRFVDEADASVLLRFIGSKDPEVRKLVARLLPESLLSRMKNDSNSSVRAAVASRCSSKIIDEMIVLYPHDETLKQIEEKKILKEGGIKAPKIEDEDFDIYGEFHLGDIDDSLDDLDLTDQWYDTAAQNIIREYGTNLEGQWEELAVKRLCDSFSSFGKNVDYEKLLDAVYEKLSERDEAVVAETSLKDIAKRLRLEESKNVKFMPIISESCDDVENLLMSNLSTSDFNKKFEEVFSVKKSVMENPERKFGISEGARTIMCPVTAKTPSNHLRSSDERAIDAYVKNWNSQQSLRKRFYCLSWSPHPESENKISFHVGLK